MEASNNNPAVIQTQITSDLPELLALVASANENGVVFTHADGKIFWANDSFSRLTGYSHDEIMGKTPIEICKGPLSDKEAIRAMHEAVVAGQSFRQEIIHYRKNGSWFWGRAKAQSFKNKDTGLLQYFAIIDDITPEKQHILFETSFRQALEKIGDNVWEHDYRTGKTMFSKSTEEFLGYSATDAANNERIWWDSVHPEDIPMLEQSDRDYRAGQCDSHQLEYRIIHKDGTERWVLDRGVVIEKDPAGMPLRIMGTHTDITRQKQLQLALTEARNQAEELARAKENFLANMSHEIRTPINAIMGMSNQLGKTALNNQQVFYLDTIHTATEELLAIINDILDLSKIEAGRFAIEYIGFDLQEVIGRARRVLLHKAQEKGLQFHISHFDEHIAPVLIGDPHRLNQVLMNLLSNAMKFTEQGSVDISVNLLDDTASQQTIQIIVKDTGIGMEAQFLEKLFDKFSQEYESVSRKFGGTGLGMSICKELLLLMNGNITVTSEKAKGTCIAITIPWQKGTISDLPQKDKLLIHAEVLSGRKVLLVDDNDLNRLVASTILHHYGATVLESGNGRDAVALATSEHPDIILMDIQMPIMNGYEAAMAIRAMQPNVPIIALTANAVKGEMQKCTNAGMNGYIAKPFKEMEFIRSIVRHINIREELIPGKLYSLTELDTLYENDRSIVQRIIQIFIEQSNLAIEQFQQALSEGNHTSIAALAHKIKPSIDLLQIYALQDPIRLLEQLPHAPLTESALQDSIRQIKAMLAAVVNQLQQDFQ